MYPQNDKDLQGRIRLLYEAYPMAYIVEYAGGLSSNGNKSLLDVEFPWDDVHQKTPIYYGSVKEIVFLKAKI